MTVKAVEIWFRFEDHMVSDGVDEFDNPLGPGHIEIYMREFEVEKHTRKGVWLRGFMFRRFCLNETRRKFACPTMESALASFLARKRKQMQIYENRVSRAEQACVIAVEKIEECYRTKFNRKVLNDWIGA